MPANERRLWAGKCGHILGEIKRVVLGEHRVRALMLYEMSVLQAPEVMPLLRGKVIGSMDAIRCTICGRERDWILGEDAMQELLSRVAGGR